VSSDHVHDPDLLDALDALEPAPLDTFAWRVTWVARDPLAGGTGGGRWHPPNDFEALYASLDSDVAIAEIYHHLSKAPVFSTSHVKINTLKAKAQRVLVFDDLETLIPLGVDPEAVRRGDYARTREIGSAARFLYLDGLVVPSARRAGANLVLFPDRLDDLEALSVVETRNLNWPAWRERVKS
jgi:RES domain-containing protein